MFGAMRRRGQRGFSNWAGNQRSRPAQIVGPESVEEIADLVAGASERGERVKPVGAGHSFTGVALTTGTQVDLGGLAELENVDATTGRVIVGAGIGLADLNRALHGVGRALPNLGDIDAQTLAGATATGTHGTGSSYGNLSTGIVGFELVTGIGEVLWCDSETNSEIFRAGRVAVGALGIFTRIELDTVPTFNLRTVETVEPVEAILADWDGFTASAEHPEFFWVPGTRRCLVKRSDRTPEEPSRVATVRRQTEKIMLENLAFGAAMRTVRRFPASRNRVQRLLGRAMSPSTHVDVSHKVFATPRHVRFVEMEYAVPIEAMPEVFPRVQDLVAFMPSPPSFPIEVRVSAADDITLSTAFGRGSGWIAVHRYKGMEYEPYFRGVEQIMADYGGRPHWGKLHFQTVDSLAPLYPDWADFAAVRRRTDPSGTFRNDYLDRVLGSDLG